MTTRHFSRVEFVSTLPVAGRDTAGYRAVCACGWSSRVTSKPYLAHHDADEHATQTEVAS